MVPRKKETPQYGTQVTKMGLVGIRKGSWSIPRVKLVYTDRVPQKYIFVFLVFSTKQKYKIQSQIQSTFCVLISRNNNRIRSIIMYSYL